VLVHAAAGGVGGFAVQLARSAGAEVVGTASAANADYVRGLGATDVIDYRNPDYDRYRASFDLVFDLVGGDATTQSLTALRNGGALVGAVPVSDALREQAAAAGIRAVGFQVHPDGRQLREIAALIEAGKVRTTIAAVYPTCLKRIDGLVASTDISESHQVGQFSGSGPRDSGPRPLLTVKGLLADISTKPPPSDRLSRKRTYL
jgi:NADPH:quinone reductase-like Zn-dependent oxidoreductase